MSKDERMPDRKAEIVHKGDARSVVDFLRQETGQGRESRGTDKK